jgi:hypothetical protein
MFPQVESGYCPQDYAVFEVCGPPTWGGAPRGLEGALATRRLTPVALSTCCSTHQAPRSRSIEKTCAPSGRQTDQLGRRACHQRESGEEYEAWLADLYASRCAGLG